MAYSWRSGKRPVIVFEVPQSNRQYSRITIIMQRCRLLSVPKLSIMLTTDGKANQSESKAITEAKMHLPQSVQQGVHLPSFWGLGHYMVKGHPAGDAEETTQRMTN